MVVDSPGFVCNRLQFALFREAARMVEDGHATAEQIDTIVRASFGFRLALYGPFAVADMAGLDIYANSYTSLERALGDRFTVPPSLKARVDAGDLGIKTGAATSGSASPRRRTWSPLATTRTASWASCVAACRRQTAESMTA